MHWSACCEECDQEWGPDEQVENTGSDTPPENCIYCGSGDVLVENA